MKKPILFVLLMISIIICGISYLDEFRNNKELSEPDFSKVLTIEDMHKEYANKDNKDNIFNVSDYKSDLEPPHIGKTNSSTEFNNRLSAFQDMFLNKIGTNQILNEEPFDGFMGSGVLEIYNKKSFGFYKFRYIYSEDKNIINHGVELNYAITSSKLNIESFSLDEVHRVMTGVSLEPYVVTKMNDCLSDYKKVAQVNLTSATDPNKLQYTEFTSTGVKYRISVIGSTVTISSNITIRKQ